MNSIIKIKKVYPRKKYILECEFENGIKKEYNLQPIIEKYEVFKKLETEEELFYKVVVDVGGYGIRFSSWRTMGKWKSYLIIKFVLWINRKKKVKPYYKALLFLSSLLCVLKNEKEQVIIWYI